MRAALLPDRGVVKVAGADVRRFLNGLLTSDVTKVAPGAPRYAALLTPQGKVIVDCIVVEAPAKDGGGFFLDCPRARATALVDRLNFYKLRAKLLVEDLSEILGVMAAWNGSGATDCGLAYPDPRPAALGMRIMLPPHLVEQAARELGAELADAAAYEAQFPSVPWLGHALWAAALFTAGLTAFYMFRLVALTFWGAFRGTKEQEAHIHESPRSMTVPLVVLASLSAIGGLAGIPSAIWKGGDKVGDFLSPILLPLAGAHAVSHEVAASTEFLLMGLSVAVAAGGILLAFSWYAKGRGETPARIAARFPGVYRVVSNKYFVDEFYDSLFVEGLAKGGGRLLWDFDATVVDGAVNGARHLTIALSWISSLFDQYVVDGLVNGVANTLQAGFRMFRGAQTGRVQNYALVMGGGVFGLVAVYLLFR